jgi:hypothetical protein
MKNTDPLMGAKLKSKTHLQNTFLDFLSRFLRIWLKITSKASLTNMSKSEKSAYFCHIFANNFLGAFFQNFFNGFEISVKFCFFLPILNFLIKNFFLLLLALFVHFDCNCAGNGSKKRKIFFMNVS